SFRCLSNTVQVCADDGNSYVDRVNCTLTDQVCLADYGCRACFPNARSCDGFDILRCNPDGTGADPIATCDFQSGDVCNAGSCINACDLAAQSRSYEGCEYWAVDLDNAVTSTAGSAAAQQFAVALSNSSGLIADVTVEIMCT